MELCVLVFLWLIYSLPLNLKHTKYPQLKTTVINLFSINLYPLPSNLRNVIFRRFISIYVRGTSGSKKTFDDDEVPVSAVVVHKNRIICIGYNQINIEELNCG